MDNRKMLWLKGEEMIKQMNRWKNIMQNESKFTQAQIDNFTIQSSKTIVDMGLFSYAIEDYMTDNLK
ncbi:hypothetical protein [Clostridium tagluense]|uniref:Uncharacterized protein n=1 Tax=Clostridium tagluense TaxID=360422 RepID=A0A401UQC6_9CLOT|nr:hypothetical protein [Clostridium tagluense]GCD11720.1 hypothetical protein Ctaglu_33430 [Clostridium tagluense]